MIDYECKFYMYCLFLSEQKKLIILYLHVSGISGQLQWEEKEEPPKNILILHLDLKKKP